MKILNYHESDFLVAHFQGGSYAGYYAFSEHFKKQEITVPDNVTVVTVCNNPDKSMLIAQLEKNGIAFINKAQTGGGWSNLKKIGYIKKALKEVTTEYVLILDASDILLTRPLDTIFDRLAEYEGKKLIFNATKTNYPNELIDRIPDRDFRGDYRFFNAGACFGKTECAVELYERADLLLYEDKLYNPRKSEQLVIRHVFKDMTDVVDFDHKCNIFQTFANTTVKIIVENEEFAII